MHNRGSKCSEYVPQNENQQVTFHCNLLIFSVAGAGIEPMTS